jgi:hypothetical protein
LLSGRTFTWHDDKDAPRVAVVNREFARRIFSSPTNAIGRYFKMPDGTRIEVVGIVEDGKYGSLTEDPQPAMFLPILQSPSTSTWLVVRSSRDPQQLAAAIRSTLQQLDAGLPFYIQTRYKTLDYNSVWSAHGDDCAGGAGRDGGAAINHRHLRNGAYSVSKRLRELGIRIALGAQRSEVLQAALGRPFKLLAFGFDSRIDSGVLASRVLAFVVYQATPRDPLVLGWRGSGYGVAGVAGHLDSSATRTAN